MDYPVTDDDWVRLAECIVTRDPGISPETVGSLSVDATTTIFSWFEGEERRKALVLRQYGRDRLIELGKQTGCLEEREELRLGERMIEVPLGRLLPTVYGDWVNLAEDIKDRRPDLATEVNTSLNSIMRHDSEMAKQQLEKIAKEIGIM